MALNLDDEIEPIPADPEQMKQIFLNLTRNAFEAMGQGGVLQIGTKSVRPTQERSGRRTRLVEIVFHDEGPGIDPKLIKNIFIPFFTTKGSGTGLGLPICQRIVESHGGTIEAKSRPGYGTSFVIRLRTERGDLAVPADGEDGDGEAAKAGGGARKGSSPPVLRTKDRSEDLESEKKRKDDPALPVKQGERLVV